MGKLSKWRKWAAVTAGVVVLAGGSYTVARSGIFSPEVETAVAAKPATYWVEGDDKTASATLEAALKQAGYMPQATGEDGAAIILARTQREDTVPVLNATAAQPASLGSGVIAEPADTPGYYLGVRVLPEAARPKLRAELADRLKTAAAGQEWSLTAIGDIIIGRTVYLQMRRYNDMERPFAVLAPAVKQADLTLADLECAFSDERPVITDGGMTFVSPLAAAAGLQTSGIDAVSVSNNHVYNGWAAGYASTLDRMAALGIQTFGGGRNAGEAHAARIMTVKGTKVALLGYSSIVGSQAAGADSPGMATLGMAPWGPFDEAKAAQMEADIKAAKQQADVVMVYYHWGTEYTHDANADQRQIAHRAIDAGADLILGTHPHWVQGIEWYKDRLITYSLGNFVFDQEWSAKTKQGTYLNAKFAGGRLIGAELIPYQIVDYNQPRPASPEMAQAILKDIYSHSWWPQP